MFELLIKGDHAMKYRCTNCKYKFEPKAGKVPQRCPYCNAQAVRKDETASDILEQIENNDRF
jgi:DNA-directed RNA polymerase subunit RPC12/RpoP